jgi:hypothetical protein
MTGGHHAGEQSQVACSGVAQCDTAGKRVAALGFVLPWTASPLHPATDHDDPRSAAACTTEHATAVWATGPASALATNLLHLFARRTGGKGGRRDLSGVTQDVLHDRAPYPTPAVASARPA